MNLFTFRFLTPWLWNDYLFQMTSYGMDQRRIIKYLHGFTNSVINRKKQEMAQGKFNSTKSKKVLAFLDNLLTQQKMQHGATFSEEDIRAEVDTFMGAGHETTSATVQFALLLIGHHPEIQKKIHDELDAIFSDDPMRDICFEDLREMKYLEKCIKETLRIYPPVILIARNIREQFKIKDQIIPPGVTCVLYLYQLHRNPKHFPNPEKFDPDRFAEQTGRHAFAFAPFSGGPRNCIGQR